MPVIHRILILGIGITLMTAPPVFSLDIDTSSPFIYPDYSKKISMDFQDAPLADVLKIFSKQANLNLISSEDIKNRKVTVYLDNVPIEEALEQILRANSLTYEIKPGSNIYIVKPVSRPEIELVTRVYPLKHASVKSSKINSLISVTADDSSDSDSTNETSIMTIIESILTSNGKVSEDTRTNSLIITDIATNFPIIDQTIARIDVSVPQVLIEVEMLEVAKINADKIGVQWGESPLEFTGGVKNGIFPFDGSVPLWDDPGGITYEDPRFTTSTMDASGLTAPLQFLKSQTDTKNLARPRILTLNNQVAEIKISTDEAIGVQQQTTGGGDGISSSTTEAERVETGVTLVVTPQANLETGMITMAVQPKVILAKAGSTFGTSTFRDPEERSAKAILKIKSGDTVIIGGLVREDVTDVLTKVPILGDIPVLGKLFRHSSLTKTERELVIFITPHILDDPENLSTPKIGAKNLVREQGSPVQ